MERQVIAFRIGESGLKAINDIATAAGVTRSKVFRLLLVLGLQKWNDLPESQRAVLLAINKRVDRSDD